MEIINFLLQRMKDTWTLLNNTSTGINNITWGNLFISLSIVVLFFRFLISFVKGEQIQAENKIGDKIRNNYVKNKMNEYTRETFNKK